MMQLEKIEGKTVDEIGNKQDMLLDKLLSGRTRFAEPVATR